MRDQWDELFDETERLEEFRALLGSDDTEPGLERADGFWVAHEVRASVPWAPSRVERGERPRVQAATRNRTCEGCAYEFQGTTATRFCNGAACNRARAAERQRRAYARRVATWEETERAVERYGNLTNGNAA